MTDGAAAPAGDDLAIVVCAYTEKRWDDIVAAIESLRSQTVTAGEIVLIP